MACDCIDRFNEQLAAEGHNSRIAVSQWVTLDEHRTRTKTVVIQVAKRDPKLRQKRTKVIPEFCPFCGREYREALHSAAEGKETTDASL